MIRVLAIMVSTLLYSVGIRAMECENFRDVGEYINFIEESKVVQEELIYRGGKIDHVGSLSKIGCPKSIINLRKQKDSTISGVDQYEFPKGDDVDVYDWKNRKTRAWVSKVVKTIGDQTFKLPFLIHCAFGKDRTGVIIAVLLSILKIPKDAILEEYQLSEGKLEVDQMSALLETLETVDWKEHEISVQDIQGKFLHSPEVFIQPIPRL